MAKKEQLEPRLTDRWYVRPDDMIGGWCIMNHPTLTPATTDYRKGDPSGHIMRNVMCVGDFMFKEVAEHIVKLHNDWIDGK